MILLRSSSHLSVCEQRSDVLNLDARIGAIKPDRRLVKYCRVLQERRRVLRHRGWRWILDRCKHEVENRPNFRSKILNVLVEVTIVHCEKSEVCVGEGHKVGETQRA